MIDGEDDGAWYRPHRWGLGAGMPIAWQGWLLLLLQCAVAGYGIIYFAGNEDAQLAVFLFVVLIPLPLIKAKTRGGWKWRWGDTD